MADTMQGLSVPALRRADPSKERGHIMKQDAGQTRATRSGEHRTNESTVRVTLPGKMRRRGTRWWWEVQLPGEDKAVARPLRPSGAKVATDDRGTAEKIALEMWEHALRETAEAQIRAEADLKIAELQARFLDKVQGFSQIVDEATAKAEAAVRAREELEARFREVTSIAIPPRPCECCGTPEVPQADLTQISSGQWLCPSCLTELRAVGRPA
jgi:hypothetical protein